MEDNKETFFEPESDEMDEISRRKFLTTMLGLTGSAIALSLAIPISGYALAPAMKKEKIDFIEIGNIADFKIGEPIKVDFEFTKKDGWVETKQKRSVWVVKKDDTNITVFSPNCTHLGCGYSWDAGSKQFKCPCHGAVFSMDGEIVAGPPPRPLDRYETKIADGKLMIGKLIQAEEA